MQIIQEEGKATVKAWIDHVKLNDNAREQISNTASLPFIFKHIAVMPDAHLGMGSTIGTVVPTIRAIVPAMVGVDLGCGMKYVRLNLKRANFPDSKLKEVYDTLNKAIPNGRTNDGRPGDWGAWNTVPDHVATIWNHGLAKDFQIITEKHPKILGAGNNNVNHLGTLGTGNHFVELVEDEEGYVGIMLHSGSRGIGNAVARFFIERAKEDMAKLGITLPDKDLSYLTEDSAHYNDYIQGMVWAQRYAWLNRDIMMEVVVNVLTNIFGAWAYPLVMEHENAVHCHHNYVALEDHFGQEVWITRKGAVRAQRGDLGIIPGDMGRQSFIVRGKGNPESFNSCSHGAGRAMSRTEAKKVITIEEHIKATEGVYCLKDKTVLEESSRAYKDIKDVMASQSDLVEIVHTVKQFLCLKGPDYEDDKRKKRKHKHA